MSLFDRPERKTILPGNPIYSGLPGADLYSAWYYYECLPDKSGIYQFFTAHPHIKTNWPTPGMVPQGLGIQVHTLRLLGLQKRADEMDDRNWLKFRVANREDPLKLPPWLLYDNREVRLPLPVQLGEAQMFMFQIQIDAANFSIHPDKRPAPDYLTLFIGVTEARAF